MNTMWGTRIRQNISKFNLKRFCHNDKKPKNDGSNIYENHPLMADHPTAEHYDVPPPAVGLPSVYGKLKPPSGVTFEMALDAPKRNLETKFAERQSDMFSNYVDFVVNGKEKLLFSWKNRHELSERMAQQIAVANIKTYGYEISAARFVCTNGGAVKFYGIDEWYIGTKAKLPATHVKNMYLEMIDCSKMETGLRYEGLTNFDKLKGVKWMSIRNNTHVNDFAFDRLTAVLPFLEYLDITKTGLTHRGLWALCKLNYIKILILSSEQINQEMEVALSLLEDAKPDLLIKIEN